MVQTSLTGHNPGSGAVSGAGALNRLSPPLICSDSDVDKAVSILDEVLTEVEAAG